MTQLLQREVAVEFGTEGGNGTRFTGLRVGFDVTMSQTAAPNAGKVTVWNLRRESVALLQRPRTLVRLFAGYQGRSRLVLQGDPVRGGVVTEKQGPNRVTTIELQDGGRAFRDAHLNLSLGTSTTLSAAVDQVIAGMGLARGEVSPRLSPSYPHGLLLQGRASSLMDRLAESAGSVWWIRDGAVYLLPSSSPTSEQAVVFSSANRNLIGSPKPLGNGHVSFTGLLEPSLRPGQRVQLDSEEISGTYTARDVRFTGDSGFAGPFYVVVTAVP